MDAVEYLKVKTRMCDSLKECGDCPLDKINNTDNINCFDRHYEEEAVAIVEKWSAEHPKKTRQSEFLKMFPNAQLDDDGMFNFSLKPCDIDPEYADKVCDQYSDCQDCQREYWSEEVEYEFKK